MKKLDFKSLIVFENQNYFAINKPSGISVLDERGDTVSTSLLRLARTIFPESQVCHRIDKETTGVLVFSKSNNAYRNLALQFEHRDVAKIYHALVHGRHQFNEELIEKPLIFASGISRIDRNGKFAATILETVAILKDYTLVECMPLTGRTHQIRVHLSSLGAPILGDDKYGGKPFFLSSVKKKFSAGKEKEERPLMNRTALHAFKIKFKDLDGKDLIAEAPYPKDFGAILIQLQKLK